MPDNQKRERGFFRTLLTKRWLRVCCSIIILFVLVLILLPHAVRIGLERWLLKNGADQATIQKIELNLFTGAASIQGVSVVLDDKIVLADSDISLNLGIGQLFRRHTLVQSATLHNVVIDIEYYEDGRWRFGSFITQQQEPVEDLQEKTNSPWLFRVGQLELIDCAVHYTQPGLELSLQIKQGRLLRLSTGPEDTPAELALIGSLNNAPFSLQFDTLNLTPALTTKGTIRTTGLQLDNLANLLQQSLKPFSGTAALDGEFNLSLPVDGTILAGYSGSIELDQGDIGGSAYAFQAEKTSWNGQLSCQQQSGNTFHVDLDGTLSGNATTVTLPGPRLRLQEKMLRLEGKTTITVSDEISINSDMAIHSEAFMLNMPPYLLSDQGTQWQGTVQCRFGASPIENRVSAAGKFRWQQPSLGIDDTALAVSAGSETATWDGRVEYRNYSSMQSQAVQVSGTLTIDGTIFDSSSFSSSGEELRWQGEAAYSAGNKSSQINLNGSMTGVKLLAELKKMELLAKLESAAVQTQSSLVLDTLRLNGSADVTTAGLLVSTTASEAEIISFDQFTVDGIEAADDSSVAIKTAAVQNLHIAEPDQRLLQARIPGTVFTNIHLNGSQAVSIENTAIHGSVLRNLPEQKNVLDVEEIQIKNIAALQTGAVTVDQATFTKLAVLPGEDEAGADSFLQAGNIVLDSPGWTADKVIHSDSILSSDLRVNVVRDTDGQLRIITELEKLRGQKAESRAAVKDEEVIPPAPKPAVAENISPGLRVNTMAIEGNSSISFTDNSMDFPFSTNVALGSFSIQGLDSSLPDKPATYLVEGTIDQYAQLSMQGEIMPFAENIFLTMNRTIKNYPMINLSPYSKEYLGIVPTKGTLFTDSILKIDKGNLDLKETILLKKLEIKTVNDELSSQLDSQLPLPLNAALSMLRDKDDNISLPVSMNGPVDDLDFGISGIFITPLSKAIVTGASSYLTYALGPYGALAYVGMKVGEKILQTRLPPVAFEPGSSALTAEHHKYLGKIAELLINRPKIDIQLCARVSPADAVAPVASKQKNTPAGEMSKEEKNRLIQLGHSRALAIKDYLVESHNIAAGRMLICLPELDENPDAVPLVELQL